VNNALQPVHTPTITLAPDSFFDIFLEVSAIGGCVSGNPAISNTVSQLVATIPVSPVGGTNVPATTQIQWNWNPVTGATGYKWSTTNNYGTAIDMGLLTTKTETGLTCNTPIVRYVWAYGICGQSNVTILSQSTLACPFVCGQNMVINHIVGAVAPVTKSTTYGTVAGIPGEPAKCWITSNLGSNHQASAVNDATEASAGWYWQFNRKQGFKHDGLIPIPSWGVTSIIENTNWQDNNDPCLSELGFGWRIPTYSEWYNVDNIGGWSNWLGPWNSPLKLHSAGYLYSGDGTLSSIGLDASYWSSTQVNSEHGWRFVFGADYCYMFSYSFKAYGFSIRCIKNQNPTQL
jgi:hypothetical protein